MHASHNYRAGDLSLSLSGWEGGWRRKEGSQEGSDKRLFRKREEHTWAKRSGKHFYFHVPAPREELVTTAGGAATTAGDSGESTMRLHDLLSKCSEEEIHRPTSTRL